LTATIHATVLSCQLQGFCPSVDGLPGLFFAGKQVQQVLACSMMVVGLVAAARPSPCISASPSIIDPCCDRPLCLARRKQKECLAVSPGPKRERFIFQKDVTKRTDPGGTSPSRPATTFIWTTASASLALVLLVCIDDGYDDNDTTPTTTIAGRAANSSHDHPPTEKSSHAQPRAATTL
jgi:hypothetical protein